MMFSMIKKPIRFGNSHAFVFDKEKCPLRLDKNVSYLVEINIYPIVEDEIKRFVR